MSHYDLIIRAIADKESLVGIYEGLERVFSPHSIGTKDGDLRVFGYQTGGMTSSGPVIPGLPKNWRCFRLAVFTHLDRADDAWQTIPTTGRGSSCVDTVIAEVAL